VTVCARGLNADENCLWTRLGRGLILTAGNQVRGFRCVCGDLQRLLRGRFGHSSPPLRGHKNITNVRGNACPVLNEYVTAF
jgi:hypothetical protein